MGNKQSTASVVEESAEFQTEEKIENENLFELP